MPTPDSSTSDRYDVAIVGGGVSGLYTAWRILEDAKEHGGSPRVAIFEGSDRTGGRLLTWLPFGADAGLRAELGGMRFLDDQTLVWTLIHEVLGFGDHVIPFPVDGPKLRQYLRGESRLMQPPQTPRYELERVDVDKDPATVVTRIMQVVLEDPPNQQVIHDKLGPDVGAPRSREEWDEVKPLLTWRGSRLWDLGFWNLMSDVATPETYAYVTDAFGYFSLASNWNAAEAFQFFYLDFAPTVKYFTLKQGYEAVPRGLEQKARDLGCEIRLGSRLRSFGAGSDGGVQFEVVEGGSARTISAGRLVLAMPRRSLELLCCSDDFDIQGEPALKSLIQSVTPQPAFKLFLLYQQRWWERLGIKVGRSVSDMPIRQTYYMPPDPPSQAPYGLLMASYDDARAVDYWQGMVPREDEREQGRTDLVEALTSFAASDAVPGNAAVNAPPPLLHQATADMLRHAKDQLALLHDIPVSEIPDPVVGAFADWGLDPFGGGWNFWQTQVDVRDAMTRIKAPLGDRLNVNIVGDGYSGAAGWVEGALTATEATLQRHVGLAPPSWLKDCYLGW